MIELAYREVGNGQAVIILHGLFGQSDNWNTIAKNLAAEDLRVFTIDQRNHGLSPHSDTWNYEAMAKDLRDFIEKHQIKSPVLIGHSMGGKTVMFFEKLYPGIASKVVIVDIAAREYPAHHEDVLQALKSVDFNSITTRKEAEAILSEHISDFGTRQFLLKNIFWKDTDKNEMAWRFNLPVISAQYDNVRQPVPVFSSQARTLIIRGANSKYISDADLMDFKSRFPNSSSVTIANAAHWVHAEKPKEFFDAVLEFIKA